MMLVWLLVTTAGAGVVAWLLSYWSRTLCRWTTLVGLLIDAALLLVVWFGRPAPAGPEMGAPWFASIDAPWIATLGIHFHLAVDGLSLLLLALTISLGLVAVSASWTEINHRVGGFYANLMLTLTGIMGVFMALDLFLFYFLWELMLVPMYFLIGIWGGEQRLAASFRFFLFTQAGGLVMLVSILALYFLHGYDTGVYTFGYEQLLKAAPSGVFGFWLMMGFFMAFAVKLPMVGLHPWLPPAYTESPTAGSIVLAGLMSKTGAYGLLRFTLPLFPQASADLTWAVVILGTIGIWYGAVLAFGQPDIKRLVAYSSFGHMGYVLLGIYVGNSLALQGVIVLLLAHGLSVAGLFFVAGIVRQRLGTYDMDKLGGLWSSAPHLGGVTLFLALAAMGLPGLGNFVGEFLILAGAFALSPALGGVAAGGFILSVIYALWLIYRVFQGPEPPGRGVSDIGARELVVFGFIMAGIAMLGLYPQPILNAFEPQVRSLTRTATISEPVSAPIMGISFEETHDRR
jgi:NADH-quinone oxidoreductase subunit M